MWVWGDDDNEKVTGLSRRKGGGGSLLMSWISRQYHRANSLQTDCLDLSPCSSSVSTPEKGDCGGGSHGEEGAPQAGKAPWEHRHVRGSTALLKRGNTWKGLGEGV